MLIGKDTSPLERGSGWGWEARMKLESDEFEMDRRDARYIKRWAEVAARMRKDSGTKKRRHELNLSDCTRGIVHRVPR